MKFNYEVFNGGTLMTLKGDPSLCKSGVLLKTIMEEAKQQGQGVIVELGCLQTVHCERTHPSTVSVIVEELKKKFSKVFEDIKELSPSREEDHVICLEPRTAPINVRPYRYPNFQKNEIRATSAGSVCCRNYSTQY